MTVNVFPQINNEPRNNSIWEDLSQSDLKRRGFLLNGCWAGIYETGGAGCGLYISSSCPDRTRWWHPGHYRTLSTLKMYKINNVSISILQGGHGIQMSGILLFVKKLACVVSPFLSTQVLCKYFTKRECDVIMI